MDKQPTYEDVNLILRLYELRREEKLRKAREWFGKEFNARTLEEFNQLCPRGSDNHAYYRMVVTYWDMAASFVTAGVLNEELFFESAGELLFVWEKIRELVPAWRDAAKNPLIGRNLETVAQSMIKWMNGRSPEAYTAFQAMVRGA